MQYKKLKVLIVDDASLVIERLSEMFSELECVKEVMAAMGYDEAISIISSYKPDVVLLDIHLQKKTELNY